MNKKGPCYFRYNFDTEENDIDNVFVPFDNWNGLKNTVISKNEKEFLIKNFLFINDPAIFFAESIVLLEKNKCISTKRKTYKTLINDIKKDFYCLYRITEVYNSDYNSDKKPRKWYRVSGIEINDFISVTLYDAWQFYTRNIEES